MLDQQVLEKLNLQNPSQSSFSETRTTAFVSTCPSSVKNTRISDHPTYELALLFLFAYGSYAMAESMDLSGIMSLFFCGVVLAHSARRGRAVRERA